MYRNVIASISLLLLTSSSGAVNLDSLLVKSVGGPGAIETIKNLRTFHTAGKAVLNGVEGKFEQYFMAPDKYYLSVTLPGFGMGQGYDGHTAWQRDLNGQFTVLAGEEHKEMMQTVYFESYSYLFPDRRLGTTAFLGLDSLKGPELYYKVAFVPFTDDTTYYYFDTTTGFQTYSSSRTDQITTVTKTGDYRRIDDILIPFYSKASVVEVPFTFELIADTAEINRPIDSSIFSMPESALGDFHFPADQSQVIIKFDYSFGHIRVPVVINGRKKLWMILDSGASSNLFHTDAIADLHLPVVGTLPTMGVTGYEAADLVQTDSVSVGQLTLYKQVAGTMDLSSMSRLFRKGEEFGGLLGYDFLSRFPVLIDYHDSTLTVFNPNSFTPPPGGTEVPFYLTMQVPTLDGEVDSTSGSFLIDLGNPFGLILNSAYVKKSGLEKKLQDFHSADNMFGGIGGQVGGQSAYAETFKMGDILITAIRVLLPDSSSGVAGSNVISGIIGNMVLQNFSVLFDYPEDRLIFYKPTE